MKEMAEGEGANLITRHVNFLERRGSLILLFFLRL